MKNEPVKAVILHVGDEQYPQDDLKKVIDNFRKTLEALPEADVTLNCKIMNDREAGEAEIAVEKTVFDVFIVHCVSWHITPYTMRTLKHYKDVPVLLYGSGGFSDENGKLIAPAAAAATTAMAPALRAFGLSYYFINSKPDEEVRVKEIRRFLRIAAAMRSVRRARIGLFGYADMGLYSLAYNKTLVEEKFGTVIEDYLAHDLVEKMNAFSEDEVEACVREIQRETVSENRISEEVLSRVARLYLAMKEKKDGRKLDAISIKCVNGVTEMGFNPCLAQSLLADRDTSVICECDAYGMLTGVMMSRVTGEPSAFVEHYEVFDRSILVGVCGFIPRDFIEGDFKIRSANLGAFNTGISNVSRMKSGICTYARLGEADGRFQMFLGKGEAKPSPKWTEHGWAEPTPDFPSVLLYPETSVQHYLETVPGQHILLLYGDWVEDIELFCKFMKIEVIR